MLSRFVLLLLASCVLRADSMVLYSQTVNLSQACGILNPVFILAV